MARADSPLHTHLHNLAQEERQPMLSSSPSSSRPPSPTTKSGFANIPLTTVSSASSPSPSPATSPRIPSPAPPPNKPVIRVLDPAEKDPAIWGMPLKYVSLVTLAVQNAALAIVMHYSRVSIAPSQAYSPATAVLMNEILKGSISFVVAVINESENISESPSLRRGSTHSTAISRVLSAMFSPDCWKLSIPAILYVIQNSLQFVAVANLPVATFQVTYQLKILTTACFSVMLLRKRLSRGKWTALLLLAAGVAIVQIQTTAPAPSAAQRAAALIAEEKLHRHQKFDPSLDTVGSAAEYAPPDPELDVHVMHPMRGFAAVAAACFTSGLAGVYFEMVLKGSKADLWVRNVQLSLFSIVPALLPVLRGAGVPANAPPGGGLFTNFGGWAWATVMIQVAGGLVTAVVIKHADNILKGFATSLSILLSFLASVVLFDFALTPSFVAGASTVLFATWLYNQPAGAEPAALHSTADKLIAAVSAATGARTPTGPGSPVSNKDPIIAPALDRRRSSTGPFGFASALGLGEKTSPLPSPGIAGGPMLGGGMEGTARYLSAPYGSPFASPFASPVQSRVPSRAPSPTPVAPPPRRGTPGSGTMSRSASFEGQPPPPAGLGASVSWPGVGGQHHGQSGHATSPLANQGWRAS